MSKLHNNLLVKYCLNVFAHCMVENLKCPTVPTLNDKYVGTRGRWVGILVVAHKSWQVLITLCCDKEGVCMRVYFSLQ